MNWFSSNRSLRVLQLFPVPLLLLGGLWGMIFILLGTLLLNGVTDHTAVSLTNEHLRQHVSTQPKKEITLRLHIYGPGRARDWAPEHVRKFHFVNELTFRSEFPTQSPPPFTEHRILKRYRSLLISSPVNEKLQLKWGITKILDRIGSSDQLIPMGRNGYPVSPIQPEELNENEQSQLMNFIQGSAEKKTVKKIIRFISPLEGEHVTLHHKIKNGVFTTSLPENSSHISGLERNVLIHAPILPGIYLPVSRSVREASRSGHLPPIVISGFDRYVKSFFQTQLQGSLKLIPKAMEDSRIVYSGSGSFNMYPPGKQNQIGELTVERMTLNQQMPNQLITSAELSGRIAVSSFPSGHILRRIQFLRKPEFRISYSATPSKNDD